MGLRRRLSKKWNETVNGVLSGPGVDVDSVNTDELSDGIAGAGNTSDAIHGSGGERHTIGYLPYLPGQQPSISSTSFAELGSNKDRIEFTDGLNVGDLTNMDGNLEMRFTMFSAGSMDQDTTVRLVGKPASEITFNSGEVFTKKTSPWAGATGYVEAKLSQQTNGDSASFRNIWIEMAKVINQ